MGHAMMDLISVALAFDTEWTYVGEVLTAEGIDLYQCNWRVVIAENRATGHANDAERPVGHVAWQISGLLQRPLCIVECEVDRTRFSRILRVAQSRLNLAGQFLVQFPDDPWDPAQTPALPLLEATFSSTLQARSRDSRSR